jgi:hypothetical protein
MKVLRESEERLRFGFASGGGSPVGYCHRSDSGEAFPKPEGLSHIYTLRPPEEIHLISTAATGVTLPLYAPGGGVHRERAGDPVFMKGAKGTLLSVVAKSE